MVVFIFVLFFVFIFVIIVSPLQLQVTVQHNDRDDKSILRFSLLWGLIRFKIDIESLEISINKLVSTIHLDAFLAKEKPAKETKKQINIEFLLDLIKRLDFTLLQNIWRIRKEFIPPIIIKQLVWVTKVGSEDAAVTGILTGLMWSIKGILHAFVIQMKHWHIKNIELNVIPNFKQKVFEVYADCIFKITIGHIIITGIKIIYYLLFYWIKGGETNGRSSNRSFNENSYGKY